MPSSGDSPIQLSGFHAAGCFSIEVDVSLPAVYIREWPVRYELLDGLRGLACLGVLLHHLGIAPIGHYAVMVFFVISGYCITASAHSSLRRGDSFLTYVSKRIRRIYPPYLAAVVFFACTRVMKSALTDVPWHPTALTWVQNLTLTQWVSIPFHPVAWPPQNPALFVAAFWSLNYEEQFYLVMGLLLILAQQRVLGLTRGIFVLAAVGLAWNMVVPGGWICGVFIEYWAHFALGAALYFVLCRFPRPTVWVSFIATVVVLGAVCVACLWNFIPGEEFETGHRCYIELGLLSAASLLLLLMRPASAAISRSLLWQPIAAVGAVSYSLYLVHQFNLTLVATAAAHMLPADWPPAVFIVLEVLLHLGIATVFWYLFERPFLNRPRKQDDVTATAASPLRVMS
jgi:peptidoglycan/LPS O-acetylase OafA/YrhL